MTRVTPWAWAAALGLVSSAASARDYVRDEVWALSKTPCSPEDVTAAYVGGINQPGCRLCHSNDGGLEMKQAWVDNTSWVVLAPGTLGARPENLTATIWEEIVEMGGDFDADGVSDGAEFAAGWDPRRAYRSDSPELSKLCDAAAAWPGVRLPIEDAGDKEDAGSASTSDAGSSADSGSVVEVEAGAAPTDAGRTPSSPIDSHPDAGMHDGGLAEPADAGVRRPKPDDASVPSPNGLAEAGSELPEMTEDGGGAKDSPSQVISDGGGRDAGGTSGPDATASRSDSGCSLMMGGPTDSSNLAAWLSIGFAAVVCGRRSRRRR